MMSTLTLGVGNILLSDEGVGVHVVQKLRSMHLPPDIEVVDGGTGGFELIDCFRGKKRVIIIDCLLSDQPPGTLIRATPEQLDLQWARGYSSHQTGLAELLQQAKLLAPPPEMVVIGVVPELTEEPGMLLSKTVGSVIDRIVSEVLESALSDHDLEPDRCSLNNGSGAIETTKARCLGGYCAEAETGSQLFPTMHQPFV